MKRCLALVLVVLSTSGVQGQSALSITGVDRTSAPTLGLIAVNGSGFDTATAISVVFSARDVITATVPVVTASPSAVRVAVPPLISRTTGNLIDTPVVVDVQVVQVSASSVATSNTIGGLTVEPPPTASGTPGTFTRALLRTMLDVQSDMRRGRQSSAGYGSAVASSQRFSDAQTALADGVSLIVTTPEATANIPARDNFPLLLSARSLRAMDRVGSAFVQQSNSAFRTSSGGPVTVTSCACNPISDLDRSLCEFRQNACVAYDPARRVVQEGAVSSYGTQFSLLGSWAAGGLSGLSPETASGLGLLLSQSMAYAAAILAGGEPEGTWGLLRDNGTSLFNDLNNSGLSIFLGLHAALELTQQVETAVAQTRGPLSSAPQGGFVMPAPEPASPPANTRSTRVYSGIGVGPKWIATPINQQVTTISAATLPASAVSRFNGRYSGTSSATCTITGPDLPPITQSASESITVTVTNGSITGGGTVSDTGRFTAPAIAAGGVTCTVGGLFWSVGTGSGEAGANGFTNCSGGVAGASLRCSGSWTLRRQ
ncbi:MAG TPA: hypothetical protein VEC39_15390 [Vicinamibacterales bacterium]|nr:hypothetical protein [Vicinamibacterales bacterium]